MKELAICKHEGNGGGEQWRGDGGGRERTCASFNSLIGIPIVLVIMKVIDLIPGEGVSRLDFGW